MLNLNELESRWLKYKIKYYIPHFTIIVSTLIIVLILLFVNFKESKKTEVLKSIQKVETTFPVKKILKKKDIELKDEIVNKDKLIIKPSLDFIRKLEDNSPKYYINQVDKPKYKKKYTKPKLKKKLKKEVIEVKKPKIEVVQEKFINIKRENTKDDINHVIKRFKKSNNPALSLFIAKKYYEIGDYSSAYNYALLTNDINNDIEDSWIVFAKSLVKLNKKNRAIKVLIRYINYSHSNRAKILLDNIKNGKMR